MTYQPDYPPPDYDEERTPPPTGHDTPNAAYYARQWGRDAAHDGAWPGYDADSPADADAPLGFTDDEDFEVFAPDTPERHTVILGSLLNFEPDDLLHNRSGALSPAQVGQLYDELKRGEGFVLWTIFFLLAALFIAGIWFGVGLLGWLGIVALGMVSGWLGWDVVHRMQIAAATLRDRPVESAIVRFDARSLEQKRAATARSTSRTTLFVEGDKQLHARANLYPLLRPDQTYRAYYARPYRTRSVVSIEPVGEWVPTSDPLAQKPKRKPKRKRGY